MLIFGPLALYNGVTNAFLNEFGIRLSFNIWLKIIYNIPDIKSLNFLTTLIYMPSIPGAVSFFILEIISHI